MSRTSKARSTIGQMLVLYAWSVTAFACDQESVAVTSGSAISAYGQSELEEAVEAFAKSDRSAERFRQMAATIEALEPRFNESVRQESELHLVLLALSPMEAHFDQPPTEQMKRLGTTVWPTALDVPPLADETPEVYAERICVGALALECKYVVPEYRALMLSAVVWQRLQERAYEAIRECKSCRGRPEYIDALERYERYERKIVSLARKSDDLANPGLWPDAGPNVSPWSAAPLLEIKKSGAHRLNGETIAPGMWTELLERALREQRGLSIFIRASAPVSELRLALKEVHAAGFAQVALQVRSSEYPYRMGEYRLTMTSGKRTVRVRDIDTVQVMVQALDAAVEGGQKSNRI